MEAVAGVAGGAAVAPEAGVAAAGAAGVDESAAGSLQAANSNIKAGATNFDVMRRAP
ncbi:hypothetical protein [Stenotrophomonas sp. SORGH_AS_0321]|uniref:hypothetical protein n=1 Tax=Stenotrophomonas sp. SORGH_AS_0321 TaxID=3041787 RepID=UPI00286B5494|nr:hypothetical protein [Stenotrophomonas sp. SORGH_AS_0321]